MNGLMPSSYKNKTGQNMEAPNDKTPGKLVIQLNVTKETSVKTMKI